MSAVMSPPQTTNISFDDIYRDFYSLVRKIAFKYSFTDCRADDIIQQVFITAWKNLDSLRDKNAMGGWIATIARHTCLKEIKTQKRHNALLDHEVNQDSLKETDDSLDTINKKYTLELLDSVVLKETDADTTRDKVARLYYIEHKSAKAICEICGLNHNTVLSHLRRFRLAIAAPVRAMLEEKGMAAA